MIETSQTELIWLDGPCIISSKEGRSGQGIISVVLDILIFYFSDVIQQRWGRRGEKKSFSWRQKNVRTDSKSEVMEKKRRVEIGRMRGR